jgi:hypothetical protein
LNLTGSPWSSDREAYLKHILRPILGDVPVNVAWVDRIPLTSQGKLVQVVRQA